MLILSLKLLSSSCSHDRNQLAWWVCLTWFHLSVQLLISRFRLSQNDMIWDKRDARLISLPHHIFPLYMTFPIKLIYKILFLWWTCLPFSISTCMMVLDFDTTHLQAFAHIQQASRWNDELILLKFFIKSSRLKLRSEIFWKQRKDNTKGEEDGDATTKEVGETVQDSWMHYWKASYSSIVCIFPFSSANLMIFHFSICWRFMGDSVYSPTTLLSSTSSPSIVACVSFDFP